MGGQVKADVVHENAGPKRVEFDCFAGPDPVGGQVRRYLFEGVVNRNAAAGEQRHIDRFDGHRVFDDQILQQPNNCLSKAFFTWP